MPTKSGPQAGFGVDITMFAQRGQFAKRYTQNVRVTRVDVATSSGKKCSGRTQNLGPTLLLGVQHQAVLIRVWSALAIKSRGRCRYKLAV